MWFERNQAKDYKDTAKKSTVRNNYAIENYHSSQTNDSAESTKIWCVDGLINFKEPFSGVEELDFNPVSYDATTKYVE